MRLPLAMNRDELLEILALANLPVTVFASTARAFFHAWIQLRLMLSKEL